MHVLNRIKPQWIPTFFEGVNTCEEALLQNVWNGSTLGIRCPKCQQLFYLFYNNNMDDYGSYKKVWGFCTCCEHRYEAVIN